MKKITFITVIVLTLIVLSFSIAYADKPIKTDTNGNEIAWEKPDSSCATIQDGTITDSSGNPLSLGYDQFGYNYQAHMFNGTYDSVDRILDGKYWGSSGDYVDDNLIMKWSDSWLANVDCNNDGKLDRGLVDGVVTNISKGWETNHVEGYYDSNSDNIQDAHYTYFVKISYVESGPLWGAYDILQEDYQDPLGMYHWHDVAPGFGLNDQWTTTP